MNATRKPAVAGLFYPGDAPACRAALLSMLEATGAQGGDARCPKALIVPHAGLVYSGPVAAHAYALLCKGADHIRRVVLLGPSHRVPLRGIAVPSADRFSTPLGEIAVDVASCRRALDLPWVSVDDLAHRDEHCLEVQLPFLQSLLHQIRVIPLVVGDCAPERVAALVELLWGGKETLIVVSTDLSHYHSHHEACALDLASARKIEALQADLRGEEACGCRALNGFLRAASAHSMKIQRLDLRNSGDTAGSHARVVGYGAWRVD